ncbi:uncharacterized protein PHALS_09749 [Plasmopara halstedii]|uniref:Uncharacterized protein n=1 Tax=Plasmopara halstedii TaxID=4781 RepID=A0A0P1AF64_PLAHL|nr:uncharacterized protein PHALS_09749 [Plasmopara halstedii]CEG39506.1 hypothetical protein PHALS_09749 [Plasmopara halstedii]|eukprot:XP_024575875.1 hypothetical protein PHALS_09749 [Plasmopara halstedii]
MSVESRSNIALISEQPPVDKSSRKPRSPGVLSRSQQTPYDTFHRTERLC